MTKVATGHEPLQATAHCRVYSHLFSFSLCTDRNFKVRLVDRLEMIGQQIHAGWQNNDNNNNSSNNNSNNNNNINKESGYQLFQTNIKYLKSILSSQSPTVQSALEGDKLIEQTTHAMVIDLLGLLPNKEWVNLSDSEGFTLLACACALGYYNLAVTLVCHFDYITYVVICIFFFVFEIRYCDLMLLHFSSLYC